MKTLTWYKWPHNDIPFKSTENGIGNGEHMFAAVVNGTVMGPSSSYDILGKDGTIYEIKHPNDRNTVRASTHGMYVYRNLLITLQTWCKELNTIFNIELEKNINALLEHTCLDNINLIKQFCVDECELIMRGEVCKSRFEKIKNILRIIDDVMVLKPLKTSASNYRVTVTKIDDFETIYDNIVSFSELNTIIPELNDVLEKINQILNHDSFDALIQDTNIESVFNVDYVVMVKPDGYVLFSKNDLKEHFNLHALTQGGRPVFSVKLPPPVFFQSSDNVCAL